MASEAAAREPITVGTFCSGTDAPIFALRQAGIPHRHVFSAETNKHARTFIQANCPPETLYGDIMTLDLATVPRVDLFVAGPPCQVYSTMNPKRLNCEGSVETGVLDKRAYVLKRCLEYISVARPKTAILENVTALKKYWSNVATRREDIFSSVWLVTIYPIIECLREFYNIHTATMNPMVHCNCPQNRPRLYIVLTHKEIPYVFPPPIPLTATYMDVLESVPSEQVQELTRGEAQVVQRVRERCGSSWRGGVTTPQILEQQLRVSGKCPKHKLFAHCLLAGNPSIAVELKRRLTRREMFRFQGFCDETSICHAFLTHRQIAKLLGNAMHVGVLQSIFDELLTIHF